MAPVALKKDVGQFIKPYFCKDIQGHPPHKRQFKYKEGIICNTKLLSKKHEINIKT